MVSEKFYKFFPEYSDKLEDQNRKGKFDLTLDVRELLVNLDREQQTADYSIELYQNDFGFVGRDKYDWRKREDLEAACDKFEEKAEIIRSSHTNKEGVWENNFDAKLVCYKFLQTAEKLKEAVAVRKEYENRIVESSIRSKVLPTPRVIAKPGLFGRLWGLLSRPKERVSLQTS